MPKKTDEDVAPFNDKLAPPSDRELTRALGAAAPLWRKLIADVSSAHAPITAQWNFSGARFGWTLRLRKANRIVLYLIPQHGRFLAGIVLGPGAVEASRRIDFPDTVMTAIAQAPRYAEGTGLRLPIDSPGMLSHVGRLLDLKLKRGSG